MDTVLRSPSKTVTISSDGPFCIIGERINPTGRKRFAEELRSGDLSTVSADALAQIQAGADMLDVNAGIPLVDEPDLLLGHDPWGANWIAAHRARQAAAKEPAATV